MKRSEINAAIDWAKALAERMGFALPPFGHRTPAEWHGVKDEDEIKELMLGWDVTDFGLNEFEKTGAVLFTLRNGDTAGRGTPYAEKLLMFLPGQGLPFHYHVYKTEDIINRGGGILCATLYNANRDKMLPHGAFETDNLTDVTVYTDGKKNILPAGGTLKIEPGASVTLRPYMYHALYADKEGGELLAGEVSSINDDKTDNYFLKALPRFARVKEDAEILYYLANEYPG